MKTLIGIVALLVPLAFAQGGQGGPPRSVSTSEFRQAFRDAGIVPDVIGAFNPTVPFYAGYSTSGGNKTLMIPGVRLKMKETKYPFEFSVENLGNARNITRNSRFIIFMIGPDVPTRENPTDRNVRHFLAGNFTVEQTKSEVLSSAIQLKNASAAFNEYSAPEPKTGSGVHRYVYLLFVQPEKLNKMGFEMFGVDKMNRKNFNLSAFRRQAGLGRPIGGTFFTLDTDKTESGGNGNGGGKGNPGGNGGSAASIATAGSVVLFVTLLATMVVWM
ncbi:OV-16 antigen 1 [Colletotrichum chlorophyti]|uniref:OV-16 antigen 1 n=1 Tax=Colletotrichum chlorophyti TaxID=708187 RepID=A0A1Q8S7W5_9PEZI|nr:OV-16 antigen 1 [Colletotrichum chlorophyti]